MKKLYIFMIYYKTQYKIFIRGIKIPQSDPLMETPGAGRWFFVRIPVVGCRLGCSSPSSRTTEEHHHTKMMMCSPSYRNRVRSTTLFLLERESLFLCSVSQPVRLVSRLDYEYFTPLVRSIASISRVLLFLKGAIRRYPYLRDCN